jgi:hypothetical protein
VATFLDSNIVALVHQLKARYRMGLPVMAPTEDERPLRPEEVVNRDLDLGPYEHPVVLTLIASKDPLGATALAASARLMAAAHQRKLIAALAMLAGEMTRHSEVRAGIGIAQKHAFAPGIAEHIGKMALQRVDAERDRAFQSLVDLLKRLGAGEDASGNFLCEILRLGYASDIRRDTLKDMLTAIFASPALRPRVLPMMGETLPFFPRDLLISVATEINHLPSDPEQSFIRREMQTALADKEGTRRTQKLSSPPPRRKPEIRPWMPMIQKASEIRSRRTKAMGLR